jgi:hypothetical protein
MKDLTGARQQYAHLLLVLKVPLQFHWIPASSCKEIVRKRLLLYKHTALLIKGHNSVLKGRTGIRRWFAHLIFVLMVPIKFRWISASSCREVAQKLLLLYMHTVYLVKGHKSVMKSLTQARQQYAHLILVLMVPIQFYWIPGRSCRELVRKRNSDGRMDGRTL